jgi:hypothetical protein
MAKGYPGIKEHLERAQKFQHKSNAQPAMKDHWSQPLPAIN